MSEAPKSKRPITDAIKVVVEEGQKVRERVTKIMTDQMQGEEFSVANLGKTARHVMETAVATTAERVNKALPPESESVLKDVVYGIGDAFGAAAKAAGTAFESAKAHGKEFASDDVKKVTVELKDMASAFVDTISAAARSAADHGADFAKSSTDAAHEAAQQIKPQVEGALTAAAQHPVELTKEAAQAGARAGRDAASSLFAILGGMMQKAADALKTDAPPDGGGAKPSGKPNGKPSGESGGAAGGPPAG